MQDIHAEVKHLKALTRSAHNPMLFPVVTDETRDARLTEFGKATLTDRYLLEGESYQDLFARVAGYYGADPDHAQRIYDYISKHWFMPATPVLSNGGTDRGLPVSCYLSHMEDSLDGIVSTWNENIYLAARGGGIGTYMGDIRSIGETIRQRGKTSGVIPFIRVMDSLTIAISQGCVDKDTEILTEKGWVAFKDFDESVHMRIVQIDNYGTASVVDLQKFHVYDYSGKMDHYLTYDESGAVVGEQFVTPNHRMVRADASAFLRDKPCLSVFESKDYTEQSIGGLFMGGDANTSIESDDDWNAHEHEIEFLAFSETSKSQVDFTGKVYCVSVPSGMFLARKNGHVVVTGNSLRRGSAAVYLPVWHPEIEEFIEMRRPTGGDPNRKALNLHHGVVIPDAFMHAVEQDAEWELRSPVDNHVIKTISARALWIRILTARLEQGEPYIIYSDNVKRNQPEQHKLAGLEVKMSNLCSEIMLPTGIDHHGYNRTAVCCLSSLNLEYWDEWRGNPQFIKDVMLFLDNVLQDFINKAPDSMIRAVYSALRERSVGLGVMGFHSALQAKMIPFESALAKSFNFRVFKHIRSQADAASKAMAEKYGACFDAKDFGIMERFSHKMAIAPTASISVIAGNASPGTETITANVFTQKTKSGSFSVKNRHLRKLLESKGQDCAEVWSLITRSQGSVQDLDFLTPDEKAVFRTAFEIDNRWVIEHAADRTPYVCQASSNNVFLPATIHKRDLHQIHYQAWKRGIKSLYYCRSLSIQRAEDVSGTATKVDIGKLDNGSKQTETYTRVDYEECLACQ